MFKGLNKITKTLLVFKIWKLENYARGVFAKCRRPSPQWRQERHWRHVAPRTCSSLRHAAVAPCRAWLRRTRRPRSLLLTCSLFPLSSPPALHRCRHGRRLPATVPLPTPPLRTSPSKSKRGKHIVASPSPSSPKESVWQARNR